MDPNVKKINNALSTRLRHEFITENFNTLLIETGALLAGGFVLSALNDEMDRDPDMDIYVQESQAEKVTNFFLEHGYDIANLHMAPAYDQSFFRKNNIISRVALTQWTPRLRIQERNPKQVDIMIIPDKIEPRKVVTNFDLTFCEIWYNGSEVKGTNVEKSLLKEGKLRKEYQEALLVYFNPFILRRIEKYTKRGYKISYECNREIELETRKKTVISPETWIVTKIYEGIMKTRRGGRMRYDEYSENAMLVRLTWMLENPLVEPTYVNLQKIAEETGDIANIKKVLKNFQVLVRGPSFMNLAILELEKSEDKVELLNELGIPLKSCAILLEQFLEVEILSDLKKYYILLLSIVLPQQNILPEIYRGYLSTFFGIDYNNWNFPYAASNSTYFDLEEKWIRKKVIGALFEIGAANPVTVNLNFDEKRALNVLLRVFYSLPPINLDTIAVNDNTLRKECESILTGYKENIEIHNKNNKNFILVLDKKEEKEEEKKEEEEKEEEKKEEEKGEDIICYDRDFLLTVIANYKLWLVDCPVLSDDNLVYPTHLLIRGSYVCRYTC